ncbi:MAG: hypothetical protein JNK48_23560, partial [Bryobacterales bacterium]|nr:hypothetical protein [Bryobacterales bacterium]
MIRRLVSAALLALPLCAATTVLYDDALPSGPGAQGWLIFGDNSFGTGASQTLVAGGTRLTTNAATSAGYANRAPFFNTLVNAGFPAMNRTPGYALQFELLVNSETHANANRAGFSVILLSEDLFGIELGFWANEIWAQSGPGFTHAEGVSFDTTAAQRLYELQILGSNYRLLANGSEILSGVLRNYSSFGYPYNLSRFVFLGDDTSSAGADVVLGDVTLLTDVPEPAGAGVIALAGLLWMVGKRRRA